MSTNQSFEDAFEEFADEAQAQAAEAPPEAAGEAAPEPTPEWAPASEPAPSPAPAAADTPARPFSLDDLLALAPADQQAQARAAVEEARQAKHRLASDTGRQAALQRLYHEQRQAAQQSAREIAALNARLAQAATPVAREAAGEALAAARAQQQQGDDRLAQEYPELSEPVSIRIRQEIARLAPQPRAAATEPVRGPGADVQAERPRGDELTALSDQYAALASVHPDWQETVHSPDWQPWIKTLPAGLQRLGDSEDPADAAWLIARHKTDMAEARRRVFAGTQDANRQRLKEHVAPRAGERIRTDGQGATFEDHFNAFAAQSARR